MTAIQQAEQGELGERDQQGAVVEGALPITPETVWHRPLVPAHGPAPDGQSTPVEDPRATRADGGDHPRRRALAQAVRDLDPRNIPGPKLPFFVFGLITLIAGWDDQALGLIAPELRAEFGVSVQTLAALGSAIGIVAVLLALPTGFLVDRVKRVRIIRVGVIGSNVSSLLQAMAGSAGAFYGGRLLGVSAQRFGSPAVGPLIADYYPSHARARAMAFLAACSQLGVILGLPVAGYLIVHLGWRAAVLSLAAVATAVSALTFLLKEPPRGAMDRAELGADPDAVPDQPPPSWREALRAAWAVRTLRRQAYAQGVQAVVTQPTTLLVSLVMAEKFFLDPSQRAALLTAQAVAALPAFLLGGVIADRMIRFRPASLVAAQASLYFLSALLLAVVALNDSLVVFIATSVLIAFLVAALLPASSVVISLVAPARVRGVGFQMAAPFLLVGLAVGPAVVRFAQQVPVQQGLLFFIPFNIVGGMIVLSSASTVASDMRAARAAAVAGDTSRRRRGAGEDALLICRDVDVAAGPVTIVHHADLDLDGGECLALLGTNGAGKSTLLRAIAGLQEPANGAVVIDGRDTTHVPAHENARAGVILLPGGEAVFPSLTVRENLVLAAGLLDHDGEPTPDPVAAGVALFPALADRLDAKAGDLSGGEQQMLAIAQVALLRPRLLLVDELSLGLAPSAVDQAIAIIKDLTAGGSAVVLVEQSLNVALTVAERSVFMDRGRIEFDGPTEDLLSRPDLVRAVFLAGGGAASTPAASRRPRPSTAEGTQRAVPALVGESLTVSYGGIHALSDVDVSIGAGEIVGVIGPNGAGKSTLLDALSGHALSTSGVVRIDGTDVTALPADARARHGLGRTFQNARLFPALTVRETVAVAFERRAVRSPVLAAIWAPQVRKREQGIGRRVEDVLELLGLTEYADTFTHELSTGTRRAVELAMITALEPKVVLLDEPASGLAQAEAESLGPVLQRLVRELGCGLLVIEHDVPLVASISDRLVALELGRVVVEGPPADVMAHPRVVGGYLAASEGALSRSGSGMDRVTRVLGLEHTDIDRRRGM
ncbi:MAG: hypothetical protein QOK43_3024 [Acidimicrobiaceae bacterium]|nr:hypothetical protein [Acidimicrobiaceae bacterium]